MKEILTNPTEFGKVVLGEKKRDHCIQNEDLVNVSEIEEDPKAELT